MEVQNKRAELASQPTRDLKTFAKVLGVRGYSRYSNATKNKLIDVILEKLFPDREGTGRTPGYKFAFDFDAPEELFSKELYFDDVKRLPYYRVYATQAANNRYYFTDSRGNKVMVRQSVKRFPIVSDEIEEFSKPGIHKLRE